MLIFVYVLVLGIVCSAYSEADTPGTYYVIADILNVRLAPSPKAKITNRIYRQEKIVVYEVKNGWARISKYYDGWIEGVPQRKVARWVAAKYLSPTRPVDRPQPKFSNDPRIQGIPKVGQYGLTKSEVELLYRAAEYFLRTGRCSLIAYGDKSVRKPNTYYVNCDGRENLFFKPSDILKAK